MPLMMQAEQLVAFGSVGSVEALVATVNQYRFAPLTLDQLNVGVVDTALAEFDGADKDGADKSGTGGARPRIVFKTG